MKSRFLVVVALACFLATDGAEGIVDMNALVHSQGAGVFAALADQKLFAQAAIVHGVVTWPGEIDLAPDAMYAAIEACGKWVLA